MFSENTYSASKRCKKRDGMSPDEPQQYTVKMNMFYPDYKQYY